MVGTHALVLSDAPAELGMNENDGPIEQTMSLQISDECGYSVRQQRQQGRVRRLLASMSVEPAETEMEQPCPEPTHQHPGQKLQPTTQGGCRILRLG